MNFKKKFMALSLASAMTLSVCTPTFAATTNNADVQVNGIENEAKAAIIDGKSYINVADIKTVLGVDGTVSGEKLTFADGNTVDVTTIDGVKYAVIRDIATAEDYMLGWDDTEKTVIIVDTDRIDTATFTIMEKYMQYAMDAQPELSKTEGTFNGYVEVTEPTAMEEEAIPESTVPEVVTAEAATEEAVTAEATTAEAATTEATTTEATTAEAITAEATTAEAVTTAATTTEAVTEEATTTEVVTTEAETIKVPFSGTVTGLSSDSVANIDMSMKIDLSQVKAMAAEEGTDLTETDVEQTVLSALESSDTKIIFDMDKGVYYIKSSLFSAFGFDANTWISVDLNEFMSMSGADINLSTIMELATKGDFKGYINSVIKSMPVDSVTSYDDIKDAYDTISAILGDDAFTLEDGKYKSNYTINEDGTEMTLALTFDTDGDKINGGTVKLHMCADEYMTMDMDMSTDKKLNSTVAFSMDIADMMKLYMDYKATVTATTESPLTAPPAGETVTSIDTLFGNLMAVEDAPMAEVEIAE